ncbi:MAG TPA: plastocyanin/azurin family copper-binding protein [Nitrososphaera sp.]|nr:plastocyanin/azurin family copper-binding protein [Nitrososphaera sp.]
MSSLKPSLNLSTTQVSGAVVAAIIAASIALLAVGVLTYFRKVEPLKTWLVPYVPAAQYGGIFLYTKVIWGILWIGLFIALRRKQKIGNMRTWLLFFLISLGIGTALSVASLNWSELSTVMQLGDAESQVTSETTVETIIADEISIEILEGSSVPDNPSYEPYSLAVGSNDVITWVNADSAPHTVTSGAGLDDPDSGKLFDSGSLGQGQKFSMPAEQLVEEGQAGTILDYYCTVHPFMKGKITVQ